ncbi:MAG: hypothetical protein JJE51_02685 [Thermoanaerobaculia bacterium]|nr:hypothetical protein [Thermoanaerobaculia bacterium]
MKNIAPALLLAVATSTYAAELPSWMAGSWGGTIDGTAMEEHWTSPGGGMMVGMHRDVSAKGKTSFEFLRIELHDGKPVYLAMPGGGPVTPFPFKSQEASKIVFENLEHDFPQRIIYWRKGKSLCARVEGTMGGKLAAEEWCWNKAR